MRHLLYATTLFETQIFFSVSSFWGVQYEESAGTLYKVFCLMIFLVSIVTFVRGENQTDWKRAKRAGLLFVILFTYLIIGAFTGYISDISYLELVAFCIPACCIGIYYANEGSISNMIKWFDPILICISISLIFNVKNMLDFEGGIYSQKLSYYAAICFLLDIFLLVYGESEHRFPFFYKKSLKYIYIFLLPLFVGVSLFSGGRGGFITILSGFIALFVFGRERKYWIMKEVGKVVLVYLFFFFLFISYIDLDLIDFFQNNAGRIFSYLQEGKLDMSETSGRDSVYLYSMQLIMESPLIGYGIFTYKELLMNALDLAYPHNLFFEWLLQGGLVLFSLFMFIFTRFCIQTWKLLRNDNSQIMLLPLLVYPYTELMFSSSYMEESLFWFSTIYILRLNRCPYIKKNKS